MHCEDCFQIKVFSPLLSSFSVWYPGNHEGSHWYSLSTISHFLLTLSFHCFLTTLVRGRVTVIHCFFPIPVSTHLLFPRGSNRHQQSPNVSVPSSVLGNHLTLTLFLKLGQTYLRFFISLFHSNIPETQLSVIAVFLQCCHFLSLGFICCNNTYLRQLEVEVWDEHSLMGHELQVQKMGEVERPRQISVSD